MDIEIKNLTKTYNNEVVLNNINLKIQNFNTLGIIGPSGGGKTTLLQILAALVVPDCGEIKINHKRIPYNLETNNLNSHELIKYRKQIGIVFQDYNLFFHLSAIENITLPLIKVHKFSKELAYEKANSMLDKFNLLPHKNKKPSQLSGGQKQRIAIARVLAKEPKFLLFDEPTSALDPEYTSEVLCMIEGLKDKQDFIIVTHHIPFVKKITDKIIFINNKKIKFSGSFNDILNSKNKKIINFFDKVLKF